MSTWSGSGEGLPSRLQMVVFFLCSHKERGGEKKEEGKFSYVSPY